MLTELHLIFVEQLSYESHKLNISIKYFTAQSLVNFNLILKNIHWHRTEREWVMEETHLILHT